MRNLSNGIVCRLAAYAILAACGSRHVQAASVSSVGTVADNQAGQVLGWRSESVAKSLDANGDNIYGSAGYSIFKSTGGINTWNIGITESQVPGLTLMQAGATTLPLRTATFSGASNWDNPLAAGGTRSMGYGGPRRDAVGGVPAPAVELVHAFSFQATANMNQTVRMGIVADSLNDARLALSQLRVQVGGSQADAALALNPVNGSPDMYFFDISGLQSGDLIEIHMAGVLGSLGNPFSWPTINGVTFDLPFTPFLGARVDRQTGAISLIADYLSGPSQVLAYSITSASGSLNPALWSSISDKYDKVSSGGDGSVDPDDAWTKLTSPSSRGNLSEGEFDGINGAGNGALLGASNQTIDIGTPWIRSPQEDLILTFKLADGTTITAPVEYTGDRIPIGDLDFDGVVDAGDWSIFRANFGAGMSLLSLAESYGLGDFNGDGANDEIDFAIFKSAYEAHQGSGSFAILVSQVPEPGSVFAALLGTSFLLLRRIRASRGVVVAAMLLVTSASPAEAIFINVSVGEGAVNLSNGGLAEWADLAPGQSGALSEEISNGLGTMYWNNLASGSAGQPLVSSTNAATGIVADFVAPLEFSDGRFDPVLGPDVGSTTLGGNDDVADKVLTLSGFRPYQPLGQLALYGMGTVIPDNPFTSILDVNGTTQVYRVFEDGATLVPTVIANSKGEVVLTTTRAFTAATLATEGGVDSLSLQVNTVTGQVSIKNQTNSTFDIDLIKLTSPGGSLSPTGWVSLMDQDFEGSGPPSSNGDGWESLGTPTSKQLSEGFLQGSSLVAASTSIPLGAPYDASLNMQDILFVYKLSDGTFLSGEVNYVTTGGVPGDYNLDGVVNLADYTVWRDNLGASITLPNEGTGITPGVASVEDYQFWKTQFGNSVGAASGVSAVSVPEPMSMLLLCGLLALSGFVRFNRLPLKEFGKLLAVTMVAWAAAGSTAPAAVTNDRLYTFGEDTLEGASHGSVIGSSNSGALSPGNSADSSGPSGAYLDLTQFGDPIYQNVGTGPNGLLRPGITGQQFGVSFDGIDDRLTAIALGRPDNLATRTQSGTYPLNYNGITSRGVQMWVYPSADKLGVSPQTILADSPLMGGPQISADGRWTQLNSGHTTDRSTGAPIPIRDDTPTVVANTWYHVMQHVYNENDINSPRRVTGSTPTNHEAVLYVNGIAVSANFDNIPTGLEQTLVIGAEQNGTEYNNHFKGVIDDVEMYVFGNNETGVIGNVADGEDWGTFELFIDNEWIAQQIIATVPGGVLQPGDVNKDGQITSADVDAFVDGWLSVNLFTGAHGTLTAGDWGTWNKGDMNHDGITDLDDAFILHGALVSAGLGGLNFSLLDGSTTVPEPSALVLGLVFVCGELARRRHVVRKTANGIGR